MHSPVIYIDMDGVLADFDEKMLEFRGHPDWCDKAFRDAVIEWRIFERLNTLSNAHILMNEVKRLSNMRKEFLTSTAARGCIHHHNSAISQKRNWLQSRRWHYKPNFVESGEHKGDHYAHRFAVLIDDNPKVVGNFISKGGYGILHKNDEIDSTIAQLRGIVSVMKDEYMSVF